MEIVFNKFGKSFGTRKLGQEVRGIIEKMLACGEHLVFNFHGVDVVSNCFADECFGKLLISYDLESLKKKSTFRNVNPFIGRVISSAFNERIVQQQSQELELA